MPTRLRLFTQQLARPEFDTPAEVVAWMAAVQAQEITFSKWAVGLRTKTPSLSAVERALESGDILRMHILRPTWHYVAAKDAGWMVQISGPRIKAAWTSFARHNGIALDGSFFAQARKILEKVLPGKSLDRVELADYFTRNGLDVTEHTLRYVLCCAEADGLVCSGPARGRTHTYMLMEERVKNASACPREEALFRLARLYFQSHSPASLEDFTWWSGLPISEARRAVLSLGAELAREFFGGRELFVHTSCPAGEESSGVVHLLPPFDEFLISYKDRSDALDPKHQPKAFNRFGTFYPVILADGKIVGNWQNNGKSAPAETSFFVRRHGVDKIALAAAQKRYLNFLAG